MKDDFLFMSIKGERKNRLIELVCLTHCFQTNIDVDLNVIVSVHIEFMKYSERNFILVAKRHVQFYTHMLTHISHD